MDTRLYALAWDILHAVEQHFLNEGVNLPERRYVHVGQVALDCEQLVLAVDQLTAGLPLGTPPSSRCVQPKTLRARLWLIRCVPTLTEQGDPPSFASLDESARTLLIDAWTLPAAVLYAQSSGAFGDCSWVEAGPLASVGPEGALGGWALSIGALLA